MTKIPESLLTIGVALGVVLVMFIVTGDLTGAAYAGGAYETIYMGY